MPPQPSVVDDIFLAGVDLIGRTGATGFQIRYSDDEEPTVWVAVANHRGTHSVAAALHPGRAVMRLCEELIDGGECTHCHRVATFVIPGEDRLPDRKSVV